MIRKIWWLGALGMVALVGCEPATSSSGTAGSSIVLPPDTSGGTPRKGAMGGGGPDSGVGPQTNPGYPMPKKAELPDRVKNAPYAKEEIEKSKEAKEEAKGEEATKDEAKSKDEGDAKDEGAKKDDQASAAKLTDKQLANINKLDEADRAAAIAQAVCLVSDKPLGGMGKPVKTSVNGNTVFLCCDGCEEELKADPDAALAKLKK